MFRPLRKRQRSLITPPFCESAEEVNIFDPPTTDRAQCLFVHSAQKALAESQARESDLRLNLDKLDPVGENARAAVAQSARKQAARKVETVKTQLSQNIRCLLYTSPSPRD